MSVAITAVTVALVAGLVIAEYHRDDERKSRWIWYTKLPASCGFVSLAVVNRALESHFGRWVLVALVLSLIGDLLLIIRSTKIFILGMLSFLLAHVAYAMAFGQYPLSWQRVCIGAAAMAIVGGSVARWVWPHAQKRMRLALLGYIAAIIVMVALAAGTGETSIQAQLFVAACLFMISDIFVAKDRFIGRQFTNRAISLPLYYLAQVLFAYSVLPSPSSF